MVVESAFVDPMQIVELCTNTESCVEDDTPVPIPADIVARIKPILKERYQGINQDLEVRVNPDGANNY